MNDNTLHELLREMWDYCIANNLSKQEAARMLGVPYSTFKGWFIEGPSRRKPSKKNIYKISRFLQEKGHVDRQEDDLWSRFLDWWNAQHKYSSIKKLALDIGWDEKELELCIKHRKRPPRLVIEKIAEAMGVGEVSSAAAIDEARRRASKVKYLMLLLEGELGWFRDGPRACRDVFRKELDAADLGYISSLINMMGEEDKFQRWLSLTTHRFKFFGNRRSRE